MRLINILLIGVLLISCAPAAVPTEAPRPTVNMVIEVASPTVAATDEPTFTPIPPSATAAFTLEPAKTSTATLTPTLKATNTIAATATKLIATSTRAATRAATRPPQPTAIIIPTNPPIVIQPTNPPAQTCCKYCDPAKSKPCGDSCISLTKTCNKGTGCACRKQ
jgi:hypothetical protein